MNSSNSSSSSSSNTSSSTLLRSSSNSSSSSTAQSRSSSSSSTSNQKAWLDIPGRFECYRDTSVTCFAGYQNQLYAGSGYGGRILRSTNHFMWQPYLTVEDERVLAIHGWNNNLFVGTEPNGQVWAVNLTTQAVTLSLQTADQVVTAFGEFGGRLYAGTSPAGLVYCYDGRQWLQVFDAYGGGITAIVSDGANLYVTLKSAETVLVSDGTNWQSLPVTPRSVTSKTLVSKDPALNSGPQNPTVASFRQSPTEPLLQSGWFVNRSTLGSAAVAVADGTLTPIDQLAVRPPNPDHSVLCAAANSDQLLIGTDKGRLLAYSKGALNSLRKVETPIVAVTILDKDTAVFATPSQLYLWDGSVSPPILELSGSTITALLVDVVANTVLLGLNDGRILRIENVQTNMAMTGNRSLYGVIQDGVGNISAPGWIDVVYRICNEVLQVNQDKEEVVSFSVALPSGAAATQTVEAAFTSPVVWGGVDFGWWEQLRWSANVSAGTEVVASVRTAASAELVATAPWVSFTTQSGDNVSTLDRLENSAWMQLRLVLRTTLANIGPAITSLQATYRTKHSVFFFTKKFTLNRASALNSGIMTAQVITPRFTEVKFGVVDSNTADWGAYQQLASDKIFSLPNTNRLKVGIKFINYKTSATPEVDGFALMVGGQAVTKLN